MSDAQPKLGVNRGNAGKGRPKGSKNKLSADVQAMILAALDEAGGQQYLVEQAQRNPTAFMTLLGKVLPMQMNANLSGDMTHTFVTNYLPKPEGK